MVQEADKEPKDLEPGKIEIMSSLYYVKINDYRDMRKIS